MNALVDVQLASSIDDVLIARVLAKPRTRVVKRLCMFRERFVDYAAEFAFDDL